MPQAKRKKQNIKKEPVITPKVRAGLRESVLFLLTVVALFLLISLVSFSPQDPGWSHSADTGLVSNLGGRTGASFANLFLNLFGLMAYLFPIMLLWLVVRIYRQKSASHAKDIQTRIAVSVGFVLTLIGGCGLSQMYFNSPVDANSYLAGGYLGDAIASTLTPSFGSVGGTLLLLALFLSGVTLLTGLSWFWLMDVTGKYTLNGVWMDQGYIYLAEGKEDIKQDAGAAPDQPERKPDARRKRKNRFESSQKSRSLNKVNAKNVKSRQTCSHAPANELLPSLALLDPAPTA